MPLEDVLFWKYVGILLQLLIALVWGWGIIFTLAKITKYHNMLFGAIGCLGMMIMAMAEIFQGVPHTIWMCMGWLERPYEWSQQLFNLFAPPYRWERVSLEIVLQICLVAALAGRFRYPVKVEEEHEQHEQPVPPPQVKTSLKKEPVSESKAIKEEETLYDYRVIKEFQQIEPEEFNVAMLDQKSNSDSVTKESPKKEQFQEDQFQDEGESLLQPDAGWKGSADIAENVEPTEDMEQPLFSKISQMGTNITEEDVEEEKDLLLEKDREEDVEEEKDREEDDSSNTPAKEVKQSVFPKMTKKEPKKETFATFTPIYKAPLPDSEDKVEEISQEDTQEKRTEEKKSLLPLSDAMEDEEDIRDIKEISLDILDKPKSNHKIRTNTLDTEEKNDKPKTKGKAQKTSTEDDVNTSQPFEKKAIKNQKIFTDKDLEDAEDNFSFLKKIIPEDPKAFPKKKTVDTSDD